MNTIKKICLSATALLVAANAQADRVFYMPMDIDGSVVVETVSSKYYDVQAANVVESAIGAKGGALRLDGYSNYIAADLALGTLQKFTFSLWTAMETWPIIEHDVQNESEMTCIAGNYDAEAKSGFGFFVSRIGKLAFKFYTNGWPGEISVSDPLPLYQWNNLVAVCNGQKVMLYNNGTLLGSANCKGVTADGTMMIGKSLDGRKLDQFCLDTVNGIIDEVEIYDEDLSLDVIQGWHADADPVLCSVADDRYADDLMRPALHGMPSRNWTNETHGLLYYGGHYHVFFQKNANGPYMSRLQWGHIVSDNLYDWHEVPIAIGSDRWYDLKGCWSGCVAVDDVVTGGKPNIFYTGVDYARAMIGQAVPADDDLMSWTKPVNPIIDGRPSGLSDDFRDCFFFRNGDDAYIIVGASKDGKGACTLHKYNPVTRMWSNDGQIFYSAANAATQGTFWEMPSLTRMGDKWLFTVTPLGMDSGVKAIYWVGTINADGTFNPTSATPSPLEFPGFARDGYGLLSPSITQVDGKTIALGIVPDKLASQYNYELGWAHTYSLPREWSLSENGTLIQRPFSGLETMRDPESRVSMTINDRAEAPSPDWGEGRPRPARSTSGYQKIADMTDRMVEVVGEFTVGTSDFGLAFYSDNGDGAVLSYSPSTGRLTLDMSRLPRWRNDEHSFDGLYSTSLPAPVAPGSVMRMHVFVDHSVMDIFINDMWASSVRLFPTEAASSGVEAFADGDTPATVTAWSLRHAASGITDIPADFGHATDRVNIYNALGALVRANTHRSTSLAGLPTGIYIIDGHKYLIK